MASEGMVAAFGEPYFERDCNGNDSEELTGVNEQEEPVDLLHNSNSHSMIDSVDCFMETNDDNDGFHTSFTITTNNNVTSKEHKPCKRVTSFDLDNQELPDIHSYSVPLTVEELKGIISLPDELSSYTSRVSRITRVTAKASECFEKQKEIRRRALKKLEDIKNEKVEEVELQEKVVKLKQLAQEKKLECSKLEKETRVKLDALKETHKKSKSKLKYTQDQLKNYEKNKKKAIQDYKSMKVLFAASEEESKRLDNWFENHGIKLIILDGDANESTDSSSSTSSSVLLQLTNILPDNPEKMFCVEIFTVNFFDRRFEVKTVIPSFDDADDTIILANESQDFVRFLRKCRRRWIENSDKTLPEEGEMNSNNVSCGVNDLTVALFDSPPNRTVLEDSKSTS